MKTPICDFVNSYSESNTERLHMPGHKGKEFLGFEKFDITEIKGADSLYDASGIIKESEDNASDLFGCPTFYSTEGSSLCIRAMLFLAKQKGVKKILAGRNAHKVFITACALLDIEIEWLYGNSSFLSCKSDYDELKATVKSSNAEAVYITSPDYLGFMCDIALISNICKTNGKTLLVDNAHGAYLKFLTPSLHPIDLGADMCCDSAHKTLPCLTGGAYLHVKDKNISKNAKNALAVFGSTSPSYLVLLSLDRLNAYLSANFKENLSHFILKAEKLKKRLRGLGFTLFENEPLKITFCTKAFGYTGHEFADILRENNIECEFSDKDFTVLMLGLDTNTENLYEVISKIEKREPITTFPPIISSHEQAISIRDALISNSQEIDIKDAVGRIICDINVSCPPAVPIAICGERITKYTIESFKYYGINKCRVVK